MTRAHWRIPAVVAAAFLMLQAAALVAQGAPPLDRTKVPAPASPKPLRVPTWTHTMLANGAELIVSQKHDLPLVSFTIDFVGGADQFASGDKSGLASLTAAMMSEGTTSRTGDQLSDTLDLLGTRIGVGIGEESGEVGFLSTKGKFAATLDVLADMMLRSTFPEEALERLRARTLVALTQAKDQPTSIAGHVFPRVVYGSEHPYGWFTTEESVKGITRADLVAFHDRYFQPGRAIISVVGDVEPEVVKRTVERALAAWPAGGSRPSFAYPAVPAQRPTTIYLVDKPKAAQSVFAIGNPGPPRATPDYYALEVMNMILGGLFQSRLNHNIREEKGFSYGVYSDFAFGQGPGAFSAGGSIVTAKSDSALVEFMKELRGVQGGRPFTDDEMAQGKAALIQSLPQSFASVGATSGAIAELYLDGLPPNYYQEYAAKINAVTKADLVRVATKYIDLDHLNIVIVGDRAIIEEPLRATHIAPIVHLDANGKALDSGQP